MPLSGSLTQALPWWGLSTAGLGYLLLVRLLRWRKYDSIHRKYAGRIDTLTPTEAQEIMKLSGEWDMPTIAWYSVALALFKTYGIPTISGLLVKTGELGTADSVSKRYADTGIMIAIWSNCPMLKYSPSGSEKPEKPANGPEVDPRAFLSIARVNWLHQKYKISNDDYLYTLALFVLEPIYWAEKWSWRKLSKLECHARLVLWKETGDLMNIKDIPDTVEELIAWSKAYEERNMVPAKTNYELATHTLDEVTYQISTVPWLKSLVERIFICVLDERVRVAMLLPEQPYLLRTFVNSMLVFTAFVQHHFMLPRFTPKRYIPASLPTPTTDGSLPRIRPAWYSAKPWYKPEATGLGKVLEQALVAVGVIKAEDVPAPKYRPQGFRIEELVRPVPRSVNAHATSDLCLHLQGPLRFENDGHAAVIRNAGDMMGCPMQGHWARHTDIGNGNGGFLTFEFYGVILTHPHPSPGSSLSVHVSDGVARDTDADAGTDSMSMTHQHTGATTMVTYNCDCDCDFRSPAASLKYLPRVARFSISMQDSRLGLGFGGRHRFVSLLPRAICRRCARRVTGYRGRPRVRAGAIEGMETKPPTAGMAGTALNPRARESGNTKIACEVAKDETTKDTPEAVRHGVLVRERVPRTQTTEGSKESETNHEPLTSQVGSMWVWVPVSVRPPSPSWLRAHTTLCFCCASSYQSTPTMREAEAQRSASGFAATGDGDGAFKCEMAEREQLQAKRASQDIYS
ncbi:hypothetical protein EVG20_g10233 [Dentipellis fragilis]|uniref:ER-bound oxygenase mpaB/mpaB'/Rubber oxygenase catalytic domain-containing protein n=1 Tax=Dentipellis fragilis TaxID=205917 RepID=A0A4Y9XVK0_9AGAM|nr:hypothetical protein EVG20_g10233 [Dentipellis fragilis]